MRQFLAHCLGESPDAVYDPNRYALGPPAGGSPKLYGAPQPAPQPASPPASHELGCWVVPQRAMNITGGQRQLGTDAALPREPTQILAQEACAENAARYAPETFETPFDRAQALQAQGTLINTYTGEVSSVFADAFPPPDRQGGDAPRERKSSQLRLLAAEGNAPTQRRKREQENALPPTDAGRVQEGDNNRLQAHVQNETKERRARGGRQ